MDSQKTRKSPLKCVPTLTYGFLYLWPRDGGEEGQVQQCIQGAESAVLGK